MTLAIGIALVLMAILLGAAAFSGGYVAGWVGRRVRRLPGVRRVPMLGIPTSLPPLPTPEEGADLLAYPRRLAELQERLAERHRAVQQQLQVLAARRDGVRVKGGREDLIKKYEADVVMLDRRAESMRRVMGLVWKTRAVLLLRVHLAITARRRPLLGKLPDPTTRKGALVGATAAYHSAAAAVLFYRDTVMERERDLDNVVPVPPISAEIDAQHHAEIDAERLSAQSAYAALAGRMDRLADNLTFVGDHFAALAVVDTEPEDLAVDGGPAQLLEEVAAAVRGLDDLAGRVDPTVIDSAVIHLAEEITHLEEAGLEAEAEAAAHLEVERLLGQFSSS
ncbi:MAG: hypothetical protein Q8P41_14940 [Pseudomonadota bacterium]|nr:hypothetical protein [Pseudomonadota bacterium]